MMEIIVIAHNIRSTFNVGAIFRTCECFGVSKLILSGYTPYPKIKNDTRLPYVTEKLTNQIHKTALDTEVMVPFEYQPTPNFTDLRKKGYKIIGLEQSPDSIKLQDYKPKDKTVLLLGEEVHGLTPELITECDEIIEIKMFGRKESLNVSIANGIALYALTSPKK